MQRKIVSFVIAIALALTSVSGFLLSFKKVYAETGSPGPSPLLISAVQITGGTGKTNEDFIELFNPNSTSVNLNGYRLVKRTATATLDSSIKSWTSDISIPAHSFYLWANSTFTSISALPDLTSSSTLSDNNGVALRFGSLDSGILVDSVSWGVTTNGFLSSGLANPGAGESVVRSNLFDSATYLLAVSNPRNSSIQQLPPLPPNDPPIDPPPTTETDDATCTASSDSGTSQPDALQSIMLEFTNIGGSTWAGESFFAASSNTANNLASNITLPEEQSFAPTQVWQTSTDIIAPSTEGEYVYQWRMVNNTIGFGQSCIFNLTVQSVNPIDPPIDPPPVNPPSDEPPALATIRITELLPNPAGKDSGKESVELFNYGEEAVNLENWVLDDITSTQDLNRGALKLPNIQIQPNQYLSITIPGGKFSLNNSSGDVVTLLDSEDLVIDSVSYSTKSPEDKSYSLINNQWLWTVPTLGKENVFVAPPVKEVKPKVESKPKSKVRSSVEKKTKTTTTSKISKTKTAAKAAVESVTSATKKVLTKTKATIKKSSKKVSKPSKKDEPNPVKEKSNIFASNNDNNTVNESEQKKSNDPIGAIAIAIASLGAGGLAVYRYGLGSIF